MKKFLLLAIIATTLFAGKLQAQDCEYIVSGKFNFNTAKVSLFSPAKLDYYCRYSRNSFYVTNEVPAGAAVMNISVLKNIHTQEYLTMDYVVNLDSLSYYAYDFPRYQPMEFGQTLYFRTPNSEYQYLALRSYKDVVTMTGDPNTELDRNTDER